jgi:hypothetical protein
MCPMSSKSPLSAGFGRDFATNHGRSTLPDGASSDAHSVTSVECIKGLCDAGRVFRPLKDHLPHPNFYRKLVGPNRKRQEQGAFGDIGGVKAQQPFSPR